VSDSQNNRLEKFSNTGTYISTFTDSNLSQPVAMAFDGTGSYWVVNLTTNPGAGVKYNAAGAYVTGISGVGGGPPNLFEVTAVAIDSLNNVYFSGYNGGAIQEYNSSGSYLNTTTHINPVGLFIDPSGNVWTIPSCNSVGEYNSSLAATGTTFGSFTCAGAIAQDSSGNFWVMDGAANTMYEFTRSGASVTSFGSTGSGNGNFNNIGAPAGGIAIGGR
jgi:hypothetical protein